MRFGYPIVAIPFFVNRRFWNTSPKRVLTAVLLAILYCYCAGKGNINLYIMALIESLPIVSIVLLKDEYLIDLLEAFQKVMCPLLALGSFCWILHLLGHDLPSTQITFGSETTDKATIYRYDNHYLYLTKQSNFLESIESYYRFSSIFSEPGYLGIMLTFLLFINKYDIKKLRNIVYIVSLILTLSLAGYILALFAYVAQRMEFSKKRILTLIGIGTVLTIGYQFFSTYNGGDNSINNAIIARLQMDDNGIIAGYNRTSQALDDQFTDLLNSSDIIFGIPDRKNVEFGVGYKAFIMKNGLFGLLLFILFLVEIAKRGNNYRSWILFILYVMMFARGDVPIFWTAFIMVYTAGVALTKYKLRTY